MRARLRLLVVLACAATGACSTKRYLQIRSDPPGATVWVNGKPAGTTPTAVPFVYYGWFEVRLEKPGYESLGGDVFVPPQSDAYPIVDLPQELLVRERRFEWSATLKPIGARPSEQDAQEVLSRARAFRERTKQEAREPGVERAPGGFPWEKPTPPAPDLPPWSRGHP